MLEELEISLIRLGEHCTTFTCMTPHSREETKGRFCKRAVLANVPPSPLF